MRYPAPPRSHCRSSPRPAKQGRQLGASSSANLEQLVQRSAEPGEIGFARQPMVALLHQSYLHIPADQALGERKAPPPRHRVVAHTVKQAERAVERDGSAHDEMTPAVFEERQ